MTPRITASTAPFSVVFRSLRAVQFPLIRGADSVVFWYRKPRPNQLIQLHILGNEVRVVLGFVAIFVVFHPGGFARQGRVGPGYARDGVCFARNAPMPAFAEVSAAPAFHSGINSQFGISFESSSEIG